MKFYIELSNFYIFSLMNELYHNMYFENIEKKKKI